MSRKTFDDWKNLVDEQIASGSSVSQFCHQHQLNPKYFYSRKAMICKARDNTGFIQAHVITKQATLSVTKADQLITLVTPVAELSLPSDTSAQFIAELLNSLAS